MPLLLSRAPAAPGGVPSQLPQIAPSGPAAHGFAPLTAAGVERSRPAKEPDHPVSGPPPQVTLQRDGERVTQIRIQCGCGQVIELDCEY